ncbi:MAG: glycosyltransferase family 4 protein [Anaeromyxobacteraceae bacterium]
MSSALVLCNSHVLIHKRAYEASSAGRMTISQNFVDAQLEEYELADRILVESEYVRNGLVVMGVPESKIVCSLPGPERNLELGVSVEKDDRAIFGTVMCGPRKGTELLLKWWGTLALPGAELWLIGGGCEQREGEDAPGVRRWSTLPSRAYRELLRRLDVVLFPTFEDGGPRSLFEAMGVAACPITSQYCAGPEHIVEGATGFVIPLEHESEWMARMKWCASNLGAVRSMGRKASIYVSTNLAPDHFERTIRALVLG